MHGKGKLSFMIKPGGLSAPTARRIAIYPHPETFDLWTGTKQLTVGTNKDPGRPEAHRDLFRYFIELPQFRR